MKRRTFVRSSFEAAAGLTLISRSPLMWAADTPVRQSATSAGATTALQKYTAAVQKLKALPTSDPRNWANQAKIHDSHCPHTNWYFLPWHRAYLFFFEKICQDVLGDTSFRLPYWNWSTGNSIPQPFLDHSSPLFDSTRAATKVPAEVVAQSVVTRIVSSNSLVDLFSGATSTSNQRQGSNQGLLESGPHNGVHANILGDMGNFMSPLDPVFWLHHCNIDRIWASWSKSQGHSAPTAPLWASHALAQFYDSTTKQQVSPKASLMVGGDWLAQYDAYEQPSAAPHFMPKPLQEHMLMAPVHKNAAAATARVRTLAGQSTASADLAVGVGTKIRVAVPGDLRSFTAGIAGPAATGTAQDKQAYVVIEDVPTPASPTTSLRVFLNCKSPSLQTALTDPTYVGTISFFGMGHGGMAEMKTTTFSLNISDVLLQVLDSAGYSPNAPVEVGLVAVDLSNPSRVSRQEIIRPGRIQIVALGAQP